MQSVLLPAVSAVNSYQSGQGTTHHHHHHHHLLLQLLVPVSVRLPGLQPCWVGGDQLLLHQVVVVLTGGPDGLLPWLPALLLAPAQCPVPAAVLPLPPGGEAREGVGLRQ